MTYTKLNMDWNAEPNDPQVELAIEKTFVTLTFYLNNFQFDNFNESDRAKVTFINCHKYSFNNMNDEGYYARKYRYKDEELPWGEFYKLNTKWQTDFPIEHVILLAMADKDKQKHYIFFFRDNTFECVAENYKIQFIKSAM